MEKLALSIAEAVETSGLGRTTLYEAMAGGELPSLRVGARRLILARDLQAWLEGLRVPAGDR